MSTPDGLAGKTASIVASAFASRDWSVLVGLRVSRAGTSSVNVTPNCATTLPAPSLNVAGPCTNAPLSNWMSGDAGAANAGRLGTIASRSSRTVCVTRASAAPPARPESHVAARADLPRPPERPQPPDGGADPLAAERAAAGALADHGLLGPERPGAGGGGPAVRRRRRQRALRSRNAPARRAGVRQVRTDRRRPVRPVAEADAQRGGRLQGPAPHRAAARRLPGLPDGGGGDGGGPRQRWLIAVTSWIGTRKPTSPASSRR